jgi:hypothetical protein
MRLVTTEHVTASGRPRRGGRLDVAELVAENPEEQRRLDALAAAGEPIKGVARDWWAELRGLARSIDQDLREKRHRVSPRL